MAKSVFISSTLPREAVGLIPRDFTLDYNNSEVPLSKAELVSRLKGKDGLICHIISTIDEEVLASAPTLKVVANVAVGYNNIDVAAARRRGVIVTNTPDVLTETTADFAWTLLMATARRREVDVVVADRDVRDDFHGGRRGQDLVIDRADDVANQPVLAPKPGDQLGLGEPRLGAVVVHGHVPRNYPDGFGR